MPDASAAKQKLPYILFLCIGLLALLPFMLLTGYNHPQTDDYGFAVRDMKYDFWETQKIYYTHWSGRYFGTASASVNPINYGNFGLYKIYSLLLITLLAASFWLLLYKLL